MGWSQNGTVPKEGNEDKLQGKQTLTQCFYCDFRRFSFTESFTFCHILYGQKFAALGDLDELAGASGFPAEPLRLNSARIACSSCDASRLIVVKPVAAPSAGSLAERDFVKAKMGRGWGTFFGRGKGSLKKPPEFNEKGWSGEELKVGTRLGDSVFGFGEGNCFSFAAS